MFALVKFYDDVLYVCHSKDINIKKNVGKAKYSEGFRYLAKYSDGYKYLASIVAKNGNLKYSAYFIVTLRNNNINLKSILKCILSLRHMILVFLMDCLCFK